MKNLLLFFTFISGFCFGQFIVSDNSLQEVGKYFEAIKVYETPDKTKAKILQCV